MLDNFQWNFADLPYPKFVNIRSFIKIFTLYFFLVFIFRSCPSSSGILPLLFTVSFDDFLKSRTWFLYCCCWFCLLLFCFLSCCCSFLFLYRSIYRRDLLTFFVFHNSSRYCNVCFCDMEKTYMSPFTCFKLHNLSKSLIVGDLDSVKNFEFNNVQNSLLTWVWCGMRTCFHHTGWKSFGFQHT